MSDLASLIAVNETLVELLILRVSERNPPAELFARWKAALRAGNAESATQLLHEIAQTL